MRNAITKIVFIYFYLWEETIVMQSIILLIVLIFLNATFASAEIAVISMNEARLRKLAEDGDSRAKKLVSLTKQPARFLATIQVAITLAGFLQSAFAADNFAGPLVQLLIDSGVSMHEGVLRTICVFLITLVLSYFNLVFGELVPKRIAMKKSESLALGMAKMLYFVSKVCAPLVWILTISTNGMLRLLRINPNEEADTVTEEEIRMLLAEGNEKGIIQAEENEMIQNIFEFDDIPVDQICTHRRDVVYLSTSDTTEEWEKIIKDNRHTYYPVCGDDLDDVIGILDTKDYFRLQNKSRENVLEQAVDQAFFVPEMMKANVLFKKMKQSRSYFAVSIDEYGGVSGIITLHDLVESLVGELEEKEEPIKPKDIEKVSEGIWKIQGFADLDDVSEELGVKLPTDTYDTFSGFVCSVIDRVPNDGESFVCEGDGLKIKVYDVQNHIVGATLVQLASEQEKDQSLTKEEN